MDTRTTRLPADLLAAAEAEGRAEHRSTAKQLEHWARFGMYFDRQTGSARRRILQSIAGDLPLGELTPDEAATANALIDGAISAAANEASFAERLAARGVTAIIQDDSGQLVQRHPNGSTTPL